MILQTAVSGKLNRQENILMTKQQAPSQVKKIRHFPGNLCNTLKDTALSSTILEWSQEFCNTLISRVTLFLLEFKIPAISINTAEGILD